MVILEPTSVQLVQPNYWLTSFILGAIMTPSEIDYFAFSLLLLRWLAIVFALYIIILLVFRVSNYYKIAKCPNCAGELKRSQRTASDRFLKTVSFGILPVKRYRCYTCYWEGQSLDVRGLKSKQSSTDEE